MGCMYGRLLFKRFPRGSKYDIFSAKAQDIVVQIFQTTTLDKRDIVWYNLIARKEDAHGQSIFQYEDQRTS